MILICVGLLSILIRSTFEGVALATGRLELLHVLDQLALVLVVLKERIRSASRTV